MARQQFTPYEKLLASLSTMETAALEQLINVGRLVLAQRKGNGPSKPKRTRGAAITVTPAERPDNT